MTTSDKYRSFAELSATERAEVDYRIRARTAGPTLVLAPHGGNMEPGTTELADAIAAMEHSFYTFESLRDTANVDLHITSARYDEPRCLAMLAHSDVVLTVHGERRLSEVVLVGGLDAPRCARTADALRTHGFTVESVDRVELQGRAPTNVCNRGRSGAGVQLEISKGLRQALFRSLRSAEDRRHTTRSFDAFVAAIRTSLKLHLGPASPSIQADRRHIRDAVRLSS
jgi:phage replication-related protein YjqB (UPF0714/DUF867 family)